MTGLKILVAEDDAMIGMFLTDLLIATGHAVCALVETEQEAVGAAHRHRPDLLIIDVNLREGSGIAAVAEILLLGFVPHIFVTGGPYRLAGLHPGAIVVQKPFLLDDLKCAIQRSRASPAATEIG